MRVDTEGRHVVAQWEALALTPWPRFWANLPDAWRWALTDRGDRRTRVTAGSILRRSRITTDYEPVLFHPVEWLPAITEALLWQDNGMDLSPLTRSIAAPTRSWELLQIAGPGSVSLPTLRGTTIRQLILSDVEVSDPAALTGIVGLETLTLDINPRVMTLPPLPTLTTLMLHSGVEVDQATVRANPNLRIIRATRPYTPPFRPSCP
jgi:hypothetical protein